jgi:hypothetical protein
MNDDGTWRSKTRLVAWGYEEKEKDRVSSDSPVASSAAKRIVQELLEAVDSKLLAHYNSHFAR